MATRRIFWGFLQKSVRHRFLTLKFEPFRFGLRIRGDIRNRKKTPRLADSESRGVGESSTLRIGSFFDYEYLREFEAQNGTVRKVL